MITTKPAPAESVTPSPPSRLPSAPTRRAVAFGLIAGLLFCAILPYNDYFVAATFLSGNFFPITAIGAILFLTLLINPLLIKIGRRAAIFKPAEIMTVWAILIAVAGIPSSGLMRYMIPQVVAPHYFASKENNWESLLIAHLPAKLLVHDQNAVRWFYDGLPRGASIPWSAWTEPMMWWGIFIACMFLAFFSLSAILRRQWVENERFTFPLVALPVLLSEEPAPGRTFNTLLRSPLLWVAVLLVTVLHTAKGMHQLLPSVPDITTAINSSDFITTAPYNGLNNITLAVFPLVIGFAFLLSSEVCFSLWFFYLIFKGQMLIGLLYNWNMVGGTAGICMGPSFLANQEAGGAIALVIWTIWSMRAHLRAVWRKAILGAKDIDDSGEPLSYRFALFGAVAAYAGLFAWLSVMGVQPLMAAGVLVGSLAIFVMLSWLVSQAGVLFMQQTFIPSQVMTNIAGSHPFDTSSLLVSSLTEHVGWFDARELMMPSLMNSLKGSAEVNLDSRRLFRALALSVALAVPVSAISSIWLPYTHGGATAMQNQWGYSMAPQMPFNWATSLVQGHQPIDWSAVAEMIGGALFMLALFLCRAYISFGFHPAGFLVAATYPMYMLWFSLLLGWAVKTPLIRYGGLSAYRKALPFFMGLIVGDCLNALVWVVIGLTTGKGYSLLPT